MHTVLTHNSQWFFFVISGDSIIDRLAQNGNFDNYITTAIGGYIFNRYIGPYLGLPSVTDVLDTLGIGRSFDNDQKRSAQQTGLLNFLQDFDQNLLQTMKAIDNAILYLANNNETTIRFDELPSSTLNVTFEFLSNEGQDQVSRSRRSTGQGRQNYLNNLMEVVDDSIVEVREFLDEADEKSDRKDNAIMTLMKAVDTGLVRLRQSFVNDTESDNTEGALGYVTNVIDKGLKMADLVLNQTTIYSVGGPEQESPEKPEDDDDNDSFTEILKLADQELKDVQDYFIESDTGQVQVPGDEVQSQEGSLTTLLKLADQEILDIVRYFRSNETSASNDLTTSTTKKPKVEEYNAVIKVMKIADDQIKDLVDFFQGDKKKRNDDQTSTEAPIDTTDSGFLKFMKRVDKDFHEAQDFLYNVTDNFIPLEYTLATPTTTTTTKSTTLVTTSNTNNRLAPIPISDPPANAPAKQDNNDNNDVLNSGLILGSVMSGLAMGGILGLAEMIFNTGGMILSRSRTNNRRKGNTYPSKKKVPKYKSKKVYVVDESKPEPDREHLDLLQDLKDEYDYYYDYYYDEDEYPKDYQLLRNYTRATKATTSRPRYHYYPTTPKYPINYSTQKPYPVYPTPKPQYPPPSYPQYQYPKQPYPPPSSSYQNAQYPSQQYYHNGYQYQQYQYPQYSITKKLGEYQNEVPGPNQQYPPQSDTLDVYNRKYEYQFYAKPPGSSSKIPTRIPDVPPDRKPVERPPRFLPTRKPVVENNKMDSSQYIYLDQDDVEKIEFDFDMDDNDYKILPFEYTPLDYDKYDMDEYGNLDLTKPGNPTSLTSIQIHSILSITESTTPSPYGEKLVPKPNRPKKKRRKRIRPINRKVFSKRYGISYVRPLRIRPLHRQRIRHRGRFYRNRQRPRIPLEVIRRSQQSDTYMKSLRSSLDFNGIVALAGLWVVWNTFLVSIVPNSFLLDIVNNVGRSNGRSSTSSSARKGRSGFSDFEKNLSDFQRIVQMLEAKKKS